MWNETDLMTLSIDAQLKERATELAKLKAELKLKTHWVRHEDDGYVGSLGEAMFERLYPEAEYANKPDFDFLLFGSKIDVKTCRHNVLYIRPDFSGSIPTYYQQKTDYYVFARVILEKDILFMIGFIPAKEAYDPDKSVYYPVGSAPSHWDRPMEQDMRRIDYKFCASLSELRTTLQAKANPV